MEITDAKQNLGACRVDNLFEANLGRHFCSNLGQNVNSIGLLAVRLLPLNAIIARKQATKNV